MGEVLGVLLWPVLVYLAYRWHGLYERARHPVRRCLAGYQEHRRRWRA
jgi:hypothetical protein